MGTSLRLPSLTSQLVARAASGAEEAEAARKVKVRDFFSYMRNHYEGTALDDRHDVSAGGLHGTFRNGPSQWTATSGRQ